MNRTISRGPNGFLLGGLFLFFLFPRVALAQVDDKWLCNNSMPKEGIEACTRRIESGRLHGRELAIAYMTRGVNYEQYIFFEQFDAPKDTLDEYKKRQKADYDTAIKIDPTYELTFYNRGLYFYDSEEYDLALADFSEAIRLRPPAKIKGVDYSKFNADQQKGEAFRQRGRTYFKKGDLDRAIADYTKCLEYEPEKAEAVFDRAIAYKAKGDTAHADADFDQAIRLDPKLERPK